MRKYRAMSLLTLALLAIGAVLTTRTPAGAEANEPITINFVSFAPASNVVEYQYIKKELFERINKLANGRLVIHVKGGPEVIPPGNLGIAVKNGTIDMACIPNAFFEDLVPGIGVTHLSPFTAAEERKNGVFEAIAELYTKAGMVYLGRGEATEPGYFVMFLNKKAERPEQFKGLRLGGSTSFHGQFLGLGGIPSTLAITEYNTAFERGLVDGSSTSVYIGAAFGLQGVSKYVVQPGFWRSSVALTMNLAKWKKIPPDLQKLIMDETAAFEVKYSAYELEQRKPVLKRFTDAGMQVITLSPEAAKWFINTSTEGAWKYAQERQPGDIIPRMRQLLTKK